MYQHSYLTIFNIMVLTCISCIYDQNFSSNHCKITNIWNIHQQSVSQILRYQIHGDIIYSIDSHKKTYIRFLWTQYNNNNYSIKLFNIFGLTLISISVNDGIVCVTNNMLYHNYDLTNKIYKWISNSDEFKKQLQQWIIGLPGDNTKYYLNSIGYLSNIQYQFCGENISIFYRLYYTNLIPILPAILEIYYGQYFIQLNIHHWSLR